MTKNQNNQVFAVIAFGALILLGLRFSVPISAVNAQVVISYLDTSIPDKVIDTTNGRVSLAVAQPGSGNAIGNIRFIVKATPSWQGLPVSISGVAWNVRGLVKVDGVNKKTITGSGPTSMTNGQTYSVSTTDISGAELNGLIPFDYKTHTLTIVADVYCTFTPPGDGPKEISGSVTGDITLQNIGFPAVLSVTLDKQVT